ncbi:hypothetical protein PCE31106_03295 [Pandoraea cepalis]|uniref:Uncharacterized protein n=1 Tax=Pandoraea cepalis TaxID=2508294 RepID=A0A5E4WKX9_9BURK|nr:hypothetical protein PCE31106_03295 [Pandoraea cepalis]
MHCTGGLTYSQLLVDICSAAKSMAHCRNKGFGDIFENLKEMTFEVIHRKANSRKRFSG